MNRESRRPRFRSKPTEAERIERELNRKEKLLEDWIPKTELGKKVKKGDIKDIDEILNKGMPILEGEIVDILLPELQTELIAVGQSKGKFGGGKRSIWRQTQKKTAEGNKPKFTAVVIVGDKRGYIGIGRGKAKETVPARDKAIRKAKLNVIKIKRGCGSWECGCREPHTVPFKIRGKESSVIIELIPAPKGSDLKIEGECRKMMEICGIKDVHSKTFGHTKTKLNLVYACYHALESSQRIKIQEEAIKKLGIV